MKKNKTDLSYEIQIEILKKAIKRYTPRRATVYWGLCVYIDSNCKDEYHSGFISSKLTLFNRDNAQNFNEKFNNFTISYIIIFLCFNKAKYAKR